MPNIGPLELAIVAIIALIIFGPKRLPELGRSLGDGMREFKSSISGEGRDDDEDDDLPVIENGDADEDGDADDDDEENADEDDNADAAPQSADESESPENAERTPS